MKVVCDTNVLISGILFGGNPRKILELASEGEITNYISPAIAEEFQGVLARPKFGLTSQQCISIMEEVRDLFVSVSPKQEVDVVQADPDDNAILACALSAKAEMIISGDPHLRNLKEFRGIVIVSPAEFLKRIR